MQNTFIQMMVSITDPVAIERGYQLLAAKRELLNANTGESSEFKMAPSFYEAQMTAYTKGEWLLELQNATPQMHTLGFINGSHWRLLGAGYEYSAVQALNTGKKARIRNKYLKSVFVPA